GIEPVPVAQGILHRPLGADVLDPDRQDGHPAADRPFDLAMDLPRGVGVAGEDQHHHPAAVDPLDDPGAPLVAGGDVPGCDPAPDAMTFEHRAGRVGPGLVPRRVAQEDVVSSSRSFAHGSFTIARGGTGLSWPGRRMRWNVAPEGVNDPTRTE